MRIAHWSGQKNAAWPSSTHYPGVLNAIVSPGPWRRLEPGGRHDVNVRTRRQMLVRRSGYGAMQLAGSYAFGPPPDRASAIGVLQDAVGAGVDHIDTAQYYGPRRRQRSDPRSAPPLLRRPGHRQQGRGPARR